MAILTECYLVFLTFTFSYICQGGDAVVGVFAKKVRKLSAETGLPSRNECRNYQGSTEIRSNSRYDDQWI